MSSPNPQSPPERQDPATSSPSADPDAHADSELAVQFNKKVNLSDVATNLPSRGIIFNFETASGAKPQQAPDPVSGETFYEGEVVPNVTFSPCKPGCTHSAIEHLGQSVPGGIAEIQHIDARATGNVALVSTSSDVVEMRAARKTTPKVTNREVTGSLCELCKAIDFWTLQTGFDHRAFGDLGQHADNCDFCALVLDSVLEPDTFIPDSSKKIKLLGKCVSGSQYICKIEVRYLSLEKDRPESANEATKFVRYTELDVFVDQENPYQHYFTGRSVLAADNPFQMTRWLKACAEEHEACKQDSYLRGNHLSLQPPVLPKRVLNVGGTAEHPTPFLFESEGTRAQYLTLSHRWGTSKMSMTTKAVLKAYKEEIPFDSLCKTFQDAITITRKLGFQYIWIDALCIVQDSEEDWREEALKMANIYCSATISLSASIATSGDSGLIHPRDRHRAVELPLRVAEDFPDKTLTYSVAPRCLPSFHEEVENGTLAKRAWCLQERVLPLRIIHFGRDQLHWECATTSLSESATTKVNPSGAVRDLRKVLAASAEEWYQRRTEIVKNELPEDGRLKQIYGRGHYGKWYQMITEYTRREITKETDRMPALAGLAQAWVQRYPEIYACGLWNEDLAVGLLWAGSSFYAPYGTPSNLHRPAQRIAPSWSWLSLDGPIEYPLGKLGAVDVERPWFVGAADQETLTTIGGSGPAFVRITGRVQPLVKMKSFSPQLLEHLAHNHQNYPP